MVALGSDSLSSSDYGQQRVTACSAKWTDILGWMPEGSCQRPETSKYFRNDSASHQKWAKRICRGCPVRAQCLQWALERPEGSGVWGGLNSRERRAVAAIAHDGTWREEVARKPWCPWCKSRDVHSPEDRRLQCGRCAFNWPGLLPTVKADSPCDPIPTQIPAPALVDIPVTVSITVVTEY